MSVIINIKSYIKKINLTKKGITVIILLLLGMIIKIPNIDYLLIHYIKERIEWDKEIILIEISEEDIEEKGQYPWPREEYKKGLDKLNNIPKVIGINILFLESSNNDYGLINGLENNNNVILASLIKKNEREEALKELVLPEKNIRDSVKSTGYINLTENYLGRVILIPKPLLSLTEDLEELKIEEPFTLKIYEYTDNNKYQIIRETLINERNYYISWANNIKNIKRINWTDLEILSNKEIERLLKDKIVIIGVTSIGVDLINTPYNKSIPAIYTHIALLDNFKNNRYLRYILRRNAIILNSLVIGLIVLIKTIFNKLRIKRIILYIGILIGIIIISKVLVDINRLIINISGLIILGSITIIIEELDINKERMKELKDLSIRDGLTGLVNKRGIEEYLPSAWEISKKTNEYIGVIIIDIDNFKKYNDTYGHPAGDEVIKQIGKVLNDIPKRSSDMVARYGGEEFIIILISSSISTIERICKEINKNVKDKNIEHKKNNDKGKVTVSVGGCLGKCINKYAIKDFIKIADEELYKVKENGRDNYSISTINN